MFGAVVFCWFDHVCLLSFLMYLFGVFVFLVIVCCRAMFYSVFVVRLPLFVSLLVSLVMCVCFIRWVYFVFS